MTDCPNTPLDHMPEEVYTHSMAAIDWLEANPDKHITGMYAGTVDKQYTDLHADNAVCFCVLGRIAKEAGMRNINQITNYMRRINVEDDDVSDMNDEGEPLNKIRDHITSQYEGTSIDG